jgi:beta-glucosidase
VQLYVRHTGYTGRAPLHALAGFTRVHLMPGEKKTVQLVLSPRALSLVDATGHRSEKAGKVEIFMGGGQPLPASLAAGSVVGGTLSVKGAPYDLAP